MDEGTREGSEQREPPGGMQRQSGWVKLEASRGMASGKRPMALNHIDISESLLLNHKQDPNCNLSSRSLGT